MSDVVDDARMAARVTLPPTPSAFSPVCRSRPCRGVAVHERDERLVEAWVLHESVLRHARGEPSPSPRSLAVVHGK